MTTKGVAGTLNYKYLCIECGIKVNRNRKGLDHVRCFPCKSKLHRETQKYRYREKAAEKKTQ